MIPKAGDIVDINPLFKLALRKLPNGHLVDFQEEKDGHVHIKSVDPFLDRFRVKALRGGCYYIDSEGRPIDFKGLETYGWDPSGPLFVVVRWV